MDLQVACHVGSREPELPRCGQRAAQGVRGTHLKRHRGVAGTRLAPVVGTQAERDARSQQLRKRVGQTRGLQRAAHRDSPAVEIPLSAATTAGAIASAIRP